jgi:hypothetical protein
VVTFDRAPVFESCEALFQQVDVEAEQVSVTQPIGDLGRPEAEPERLMLEVEHPHDPPVRLGFLA